MKSTFVTLPRALRATRPTRSGLLAAVLCCAAAAGPTFAASVPFSATVEGTSTIIDVLDPAGPVVRVQTQATVLSALPITLGLLNYFSGDVLNLGTGQGNGSNRFVTVLGDELRGVFSVQMVPGADPSLFSLLGDVSFEGGTGVFQGASGSVTLRGTGQFFSATQAQTRFVFEGLLNTVPEPSTGLLVLAAGLLAAVHKPGAAIKPSRAAA